MDTQLVELVKEPKLAKRVNPILMIAWKVPHFGNEFTFIKRWNHTDKHTHSANQNANYSHNFIPQRL